METLEFFFTSIDEPADPSAEYLQGGACLIVTGAWASRVMEHGSDNLGRWVWATLRGQQQEKTTVVTMYCPNRGSTTLGPSTVWSQQWIRLQEMVNEEEGDQTVDPRRQCLDDFKVWAKKRIEQGHKLVILTDANQSLTDVRDAYNLSDLVQELRLASAMEVKHENQSLRSLDRGSVTIDHILTFGVDPDLVHKAGQLPFGLGFHTDHRGLFADLDGEQLLSLQMVEPEQREGRRLSSKNTKQQHIYLQHLCRHLEAHNVFTRAGALSTKSATGSLSTTDLLEYNKVDACITDGMLAAEKQLPHRRERGWTVELNRLIHKLRYFRLLLRRNRGLHTHENIMKKVRQIAGVTWVSSDEYQIKQKLREVWRQLDQCHKTMVEKREKFLQDLADDSGFKDRENAIKQMRAREASKRQFRRIRTTLGRLKSGGLAGVDVPILTSDGEISGWRSITKPEQLNDVITARNRKHLHQAAPTSMGNGEGYDLFHGEDRHDTAKKVLAGELEWRHPVEEVNRFIDNLQTAFDEEKLQEEARKINAPVTVGEFRHYFKKKKESTESSPSGRHIGHYKAILDNDEIVDLLVSMLNIGINTGCSLSRWQQTVSVMLEKDRGSPKIDRLRIIQLFEADYNFLLSLILGHRLMNFARRHCQFNESQYGSLKGKQAQSAVLNKILTYDYFRLQKENAATAEFDAAANYDRILPAIAVVACQRLGLAKKVGDLFFDSLNKLKHKVRTLYGLSTEYGPSTNFPLFGSGQGSGGSPSFWAVIADVLFNTMDGYGSELRLRDPAGTLSSERNEDGYVDDTSLGVDGRDRNVVGRLRAAAQRHEKVLFATGGKLALAKCTWVLINWTWNEGVATMSTYPKDGEDEVGGGKLRLVQSETGEEAEIRRLDPDEAYRTLGAWIAADGGQGKQLNVLAAMVTVWVNCISESSLNSRDRQLAYTAFLKRQLLYPIGCSSIQQNDLKRLFRPVLDVLLHTLGLNKRFPLALVHAGPDALGLGIDDLPTLQGVAQLQLLMGHLNKADRTGDLIEITLGSLEMEIGLGKCPLWYPHTTTLEHVSDTWVSSIGRFLHRLKCRVETRTTRQVEVQRENDYFIMQLALDGNFNLPLVQQCRLWLRVSTVADISDASGRRLEKWALRRRGRESVMTWSRQEEPSDTAWREWRKLLSSLVTDARSTGGRYLKPCYRMRAWITTHQLWEWKGKDEVVFKCTGERYWREGTHLRAMENSLHFVPRKMHPVDVHVGGNAVHRVRDSGLDRRSGDTRTDGYTRLRGNVMPTIHGPCFTDNEDDIIIATDGTVKLGSGGAAYSIHTTATPGSIRAVVPVDGSAVHLSSYRTELFGLLGALLLLYELLDLQRTGWERLSAVIWCDNEAAVNRFNVLEGRRHYSIASANHADADVIQELRWWKARMPIQVRAAWVKSHQHNCITREGRLNNVVDRLAAMQHGVTGEWASRTSSAMLPQTRAQLHFPQDRYTGRVNEKIQHALWKGKAEEYILRKLDLRNKALVDWDSLGRHHRWLSWQRRATRLKLIFRWAPTNARGHVIQATDTPLCPLCNTCVETTGHVLQCTSPTATKARTAALANLEMSLDDIGTHPDLISLISLATSTGEAPPCELADSDIDLHDIVEKQGTIGWHLLRFGFVAKAWKAEQSWWRMTQDPNYSSKKGERWAKQLLETLWEYIAAVWDHRNKIVHGKDKSVVASRKLGNLWSKARQILRDAPALGAADRHLLQLSNVGKKNGQFLHHWLKAVQIASKKEDLRRHREERVKIVSFMESIRARQRRSGRRALRQVSMSAFVVRRDRRDRCQGGASAAQAEDVAVRRVGARAPAQGNLHCSVTDPADK